MADLWIPREKYLCLWQEENGAYVVNSEGEFLCAESFTPGDKDVEESMRKAAEYLGISGGKPVWIRGRKVTKTEHEVQMERLLDGLIPDELEAIRIAAERKREQQ